MRQEKRGPSARHAPSPWQRADPPHRLRGNPLERDAMRPTRAPTTPRPEHLEVDVSNDTDHPPRAHQGRGLFRKPEMTEEIPQKEDLLGGCPRDLVEDRLERREIPWTSEMRAILTMRYQSCAISQDFSRNSSIFLRSFRRAFSGLTVRPLAASRIFSRRRRTRPGAAAASCAFTASDSCRISASRRATYFSTASRRSGRSRPRFSAISAFSASVCSRLGSSADPDTLSTAPTTDDFSTIIRAFGIRLPLHDSLDLPAQLKCDSRNRAVSVHDVEPID